jgi:hypothetical protein
MRSAIVGLLLLCLATVALAGYQTDRATPHQAKQKSVAAGSFSSANVITTKLPQGSFNLHGNGDITVYYNNHTDILRFYSSFDFSESTFGPFTDLTLHWGASEKVLAASVSNVEYNDVQFTWSQQSDEDELIAAIRDGSAWVDFQGASAYPDGIARANLDGTAKFGTSAITFNAVLTSTTGTESTGTLSITYNRQSDTFDFEFEFHYEEFTSSTSNTRVTCTVSTVHIVDPFFTAITGADDYTIVPSDPHNSGNPVTAQSFSDNLVTNSRVYRSFRAGYSQVIVDTNIAAGHLTGTIVANVDPSYATPQF